MTIKRAIEIVNAIRPNQYKDEQKIEWLRMLEKRVFREVYEKYEHTEEDTFTDFDSETFTEDRLYIDDAYADIYTYYLCSMIDFHNAEYGRYNADVELFNNKWEGYTAWYGKTNMPLQNNPVHRYLPKGVIDIESPFTP